MGANAQTTVPTFTAAQVLTADQMNQSARTGVPVFADTTARDAGFGGSGEKVLAEGQLCYVENLTGDAQIQYYDGASWVSLGAAGLTLISSTTIGTTVSSVAVSNVFSSTYDNYLVITSGGVASTDITIDLQFGATTSNYYWSLDVRSWGNAAFTDAGSNTANIRYGAGLGGTTYLHGVAQISGPNLAKNTVVATQLVRAVTAGTGGNVRGYLNDTTQYTGFTILSTGGTMTGGTIKVYGYRN